MKVGGEGGGGGFLENERGVACGEGGGVNALALEAAKGTAKRK